MTLAKLTLYGALFLTITFGAGCGFLDEDLWVDDQTFEEEFTMEGLSISGVGYSSRCGGVLHRRRARIPIIRHGRVSSQAYLFDGFARERYLAGLTDQQILEYTDVETLDEDTVVASTVEEAYYETKADRDAAVAGYYAGAVPQ